MTQHPITPPPELAAEWVAEIYDHPAVPLHSITLQLVERAAQWGADQELEACCEWLFKDPATHDLVGREARYLDFDLRAARRPKPSSLKKQALVALHAVAAGANDMREQCQDFETIRLALEQLDD
jgi:hypothetical protein